MGVRMLMRNAKRSTKEAGERAKNNFRSTRKF
jgi:hypothetical protein